MADRVSPLQPLTMAKSGALHIVHILRDHGHQALLAGGCVRDQLMGRAPDDWDIATDADPQTVMELFPHTVPVGLQYGIVMVVLEDGQYEVARFRRDLPYADGRHPRGVEFADPREDARRRDFTINGMFSDPLTGQLIDYVGGREDIQGRVVRAIGDPDQRFAEDYLRMLRAVRFACRFGFAIEERTWEAIRAGAGQLRRISAERVRDELTRILTEGGAARGAQLLLDSGLLGEVLPEVAAMQGVQQPPQFHPEGDVWTHVRMVLERLDSPGPALAWAALLHDVGKPPTFREEERIRFDEHDAVGARMAGQICRRLRLASGESETIGQLVGQHMRIRHVRQMRPSKLKRFLREPYFGELLELHRIDCLASHGNLDIYEFCRHQLALIEPEELRPARLLVGGDLIAMGLTPGPVFREILSALEDEQLEGRVKTREEALVWAAERLRTDRP